jgi:A/G-specific adenine glycosylase
MKIDREKITDFRNKILNWYDRHRRTLPWRALAGETPDPYRVWLSEIMLQQTTVPAVISYFHKFTERWPTVYDLARAPEEVVMEAWAGLGYYARARNLIKCARVVADEYGGIFPQDYETLKTLPGIGDYTASAISAIAFGQESNVVDGNVERVMARYHAVLDPLPKSKPTLKAFAAAYTKEQGERTGDYAQALMDLGATICTPKSPLCPLCPVNETCKANHQGLAATLPRKEKKIETPQRFGAVFWVENPQRDVLFQRRPSKGLLGGMLGLPTTEWVEDKALLNKTIAFHDCKIPIKEDRFITHTFTHFHLRLYLARATITNLDGIGADYEWVAFNDVKNVGVPTVFKKAIKIFLAEPFVEPQSKSDYNVRHRK